MMSTPVFPKHDPAQPDFWEVRYRENFVPWDAGSVPWCLTDWAVQRLPEPPSAVLVPGCGSAWEVAWMADRGWPVCAIDFSPAAVEAARAMLGVYADRVREADFFGPWLADSKFDLVYERAFLCALPRRLWADWAARLADIVTPGGLLVGFFYFDEGERGPPFGLKANELESLLNAEFELVESTSPPDSIAVFKDKERWMVWRRR